MADRTPSAATKCDCFALSGGSYGAHDPACPNASVGRVVRRKTMRRSRRQAETLARTLREYGHSEVKVTRVTATDWAITYVK